MRGGVFHLPSVQVFVGAAEDIVFARVFFTVWVEVLTVAANNPRYRGVVLVVGIRQSHLECGPVLAVQDPRNAGHGFVFSYL
jgi:hypothetical protein